MVEELTEKTLNMHVPTQTTFMAIDIFGNNNWALPCFWRPAHDPAEKFIEQYLEKPYLNDAKIWDLNIPWKDLYNMETFLMDSQYDDRFHASRIAGWVRAIKSGNIIEPCRMEFSDSTEMHDGNHRYQALNYLGYSHFPVECSGFVDKYEKFLLRSGQIRKNFTYEEK